MKAKIILIGPILIVIGVIGWKLENSRPKLSTFSPNKTYLVELTGDLEPGSIQITDQVVSFNVYKEGVRVVSNIQMTSFDFYESGFLKRYPNYEWMNDKSLRFISAVSPETSDNLRVINRTDKTISYMNVLLLDLFLLFDLPPNSSTEIMVPRYKWQSWVSVSGQFTNGESIPATELNFFHRDRFVEPLHYCVSIDSEGLTLNSREVDGWRQDIPAIPRSSECGRE